MKVKSGYNAVIGALFIALTLINLFIYKSGYTYRPKSYLLFIILVFGVVAGITVLAVKLKQYANKASEIFACMMPMLSLLFAFSLIFSFDLCVNYKTYDVIYYELMFAFLMSSSFIIFFVYAEKMWLKICAAIVCAVIAVIFGFMFFTSLLFANFGVSTVLQDIQSPDRTYSAVVISSDDGALGGDNAVYVRNIQRDIPLLIGNLNSQRKQIWIGDWGNVPTLEWADGNSLLINDKKYDVAES